MKRSEIRENLFKMVFFTEFHDQEEFKEQQELYFEEQLPRDTEEKKISEEERMSEEERTYIIQKFEDLIQKMPEIDGKINAVARGWKTGRMGKTDLAILRLAVYEMQYEDSIPVKVAINEAVELAKKFGGDASPSFVNGILAKLV